MKTFCVLHDHIRDMKDLVFKYKYEHCIYLKERAGVYYFDRNTIVKGEQREGRQYCTYRGPYAECIFHSHPEASRSYPSREDILKVMKRDAIKCSIIATRWGIYTIKLTDYSLYEYKTYINIGIQILEHKLKEIVDKIGKLVEDATGYSKVKKVYPKDLNDNDIYKINKYLMDLEDLTRLQFKFYPWKFFTENNIF